MSDLISRSSLLEKISDYIYDTVNPEKRRMEHIVKAHFIELIEKQPTAFDVDKVIAELEEMIDPNVDFQTGVPCNNWVVDMQNEIIKKCIEIVQKGGVHNPHSDTAEPPKTD